MRPSTWSDVKKNSYKFKKQKKRILAENYLTSITLNGLTENDSKFDHFDCMLAKNDLDYFLTFDRIENTPRKQNEFFDHYKKKLLIENRQSIRTKEFLNSEFNSNNFVPDLYVKDLLQIKGPKIPQINIQPSLSLSRDVNLNKAPMSDHETEYNKAHNNQENQQLATSNVTLSSNSSIATSVQSWIKPSQKNQNESNLKFDSTKNECKINESGRNYRRTISESSNESHFSSMRSNFLTVNSNKSTKISFFNNLLRLTNEKALLTSNGSPIGVFSRLPFRLNKIDLNDSLILKNRHLSLNKTQIAHNGFMHDVFTSLNLNFDEFLNQGTMSYGCLIDTNISGKKIEENFDQIEHVAEDDEEKFDQDGINEQKFPNKKDVCMHNSLHYQPDYLDDPELTEMTAGKNRTCLKFASYAVSIIDYVKPLDLKKEINETFKEKFPHIQITLTKLRSIKREMMEIGYESCLDLIIVAQSFIYFEKLILQGLINKSNRKFLAANCLIIAAKLNDVTKKEINKLIDNISNKFRFDNRKDVTLYEFPILVALEFNLIIKYENDFYFHYERLTNSLERYRQKCLTNNLLQEYPKISSFQRTISD